MRREGKWIFNALMVLLLTSMPLIGCGEAPTSPAAPSEPEIELKPQVLAEWKGTGNKITQYVIIRKSPWAVSWAFQPKVGPHGVEANHLIITVQQPRSTYYMKSVVNMANVEQGIADKYYIDGTGIFYLEINSSGGDWVVKVIGN